MTLKQAIKQLGGVKAAADLAGLSRTSIYYWLKVTPPKWRKADIARIIDLAQQQKEAA